MSSHARQNHEAMIFKYDERAKRHLCERDPLLGQYITERGNIERAMKPDLFVSLTESIISQQISGKAAESISGRLLVQAGEITPARIVSLPEDLMRQCGISQRKISYIKAAAHAIMSGELVPDALRTMDDESVIRQLVQLPGIGRWSAEMTLIFTLGREDVLSYGDFGIRRGIMRLHQLEALSKADFMHFRELYSPYGTIASFYLWEIAAR